MKHIPIVILIVITFLFCSCASKRGERWEDRNMTKEQLIERMGQPYKIIKTEDGNEKLIYRFDAMGILYQYYLIVDGIVVTNGRHLP